MKIKQYVKRILGSDQLYLFKRIKKIYFNNFNRDYDHTEPCIFLIGTPEHTNLGDQAIAIAERQILSRILPGIKVYEIAETEFDIVFGKMQKFIKDNDLILLHGGGNMGTRYLDREINRRLVIKKFPNNKIIYFPQTIDFADTVEGHIELERSRKIYARHKNLVVVAREKKSYKLMKQYFSKNTVILSPDVVLQMQMSPMLGNETDRHGVLECFRNDGEKNLTEEDYEYINKVLNEKFDEDIKSTDTVIYDKTLKINEITRERYVREKLDQFRNAELVVTDRLHGMVFAFITGTPCVVFSNNNHKVLGVYEWIRDVNFICFCKGRQDLKKSINKVLEKNENDNFQRELLEHYVELENKIVNWFENIK